MPKHHLIPREKDLFKLIPKHTSHKRLAKIILKAAENKNGHVLLHIIRTFPSFHSYQNHKIASDILTEIIFYWEDFLETTFKAGIHPDSRGSFLLGTYHSAKLTKLGLKYGAKIGELDLNGEHALGFATAWNHLKTIKVLLDAGTDINQYEYNAYSEETFTLTALDCASHHKTYCYLRSRGAKHFGELEPKKFKEKYDREFILKDHQPKRYKGN